VKGGISGSSAEEVRRQLDLSVEPVEATESEAAKAETSATKEEEDPAAAIERMMKEQK
jgi:hypothetical protein